MQYSPLILGFLQAGHTIHIAGLLRLDVEELSVDSIYVTVWASPYLPLHMGKTENAHTMLEEHIGRQLQVRLSSKMTAKAIYSRNLYLYGLK